MNKFWNIQAALSNSGSIKCSMNKNYYLHNFAASPWQRFILFVIKKRKKLSLLHVARWIFLETSVWKKSIIFLDNIGIDFIYATSWILIVFRMSKTKRESVLRKQMLKWNNIWLYHIQYLQRLWEEENRAAVTILRRSLTVPSVSTGKLPISRFTENWPNSIMRKWLLQNW